MDEGTPARRTRPSARRREVRDGDEVIAEGVTAHAPAPARTREEPGPQHASNHRPDLLDQRWTSRRVKMLGAGRSQ